MFNLDWKTSKETSFYSYALPSILESNEKILLQELIEVGKNSSTGRARICFHESPSSPLHVMLIYHDHRTKVKKHKHLNFGEFIVPLLGDFDVYTYNSNADTLANKIRITEGRQFPFFIAKGIWHSLVFFEPTLFYEYTIGPFDERSAVYRD